jgi:hypothetical protein
MPTSSRVLFPYCARRDERHSYGDITALEVNNVAVIEFKPNLAVEDDGVLPRRLR